MTTDPLNGPRLKRTKNDPHNPERLLDRKMNENQNGDLEQHKGSWVPTKWNDTGAGKGDAVRPRECSQEEYGIKYDLATGKITRKEFDKLMKDLNS
jgi:hypothetical protein